MSALTGYGRVQFLDMGDSRVVAAMSLRNVTCPAAYSMRRTGPDAAFAVSNIADFAACVGFDADRQLVIPRRWPHLARVMVVEESGMVADPIIGNNPRLPVGDKPGFEHSCDGLLTREPGVFLGVQGADCPMLFLYEPTMRIVGAAHCGWRPVARRIVTGMIDSFQRLGAKTDAIRAFVSPGAGDEVYEFSMDESSLPLLKEQRRLGDFAAALAPHKSKTASTVLQLNELVVRDLKAAGVPAANITNDPRSCIADETLHSYRRDGSPDMATSRHGLSIGVIALRR